MIVQNCKIEERPACDDAVGDKEVGDRVIAVKKQRNCNGNTMTDSDSIKNNPVSDAEMPQGLVNCKKTMTKKMIKANERRSARVNVAVEQVGTCFMTAGRRC